MLGLKAFAEGRRKFLLNYPGIKNAAPSPISQPPNRGAIVSRSSVPRTGLD